MKPSWLLSILMALTAAARETRVELQNSASGPELRIFGSPRKDWWIEVSSDLESWSRPEGMPPLISDETEPPGRAVSSGDSSGEFFRVTGTDGLYDDSLIRTFHLTFVESNWQSLLTTARTTGTNVTCTLELDNGAVRTGVGARYKGNTSFTMGGTKKSVNLEINWTHSESELLGYETVNLNNAAGDGTILREPIYFNVMHRYAPSPRGALASLFINGANWGVYSLAQQEDGDLIREWFPSNDGDRWRAPNVGGGTGGGPGGPGGGGGGNPFASAASALSWQGGSISDYTNKYELKKAADSNLAWQRLFHAIDVLNNTAEESRRTAVEEVLAVDSWMWFLAVENLFADDDSYWNKGADYGFYYEPESGRIHPVEHDGNEAFLTSDVSLSPLSGITGTNRPVISKLLVIPELKQRYLAHMRTVLDESFHPDVMTPLIDRLSALSLPAIAADPKKSFTMTAYTNNLKSLKSFVTNRYVFLTNHAELRPVPPKISSVTLKAEPAAGSTAAVTAVVQPSGDEGIDSVWLWYRGGPVGKYTAVPMWDDGAHQDGAAGDGVYGAEAGGFLAGVKVRYYVEARSANTAQAAAFQPAHAELGPLTYRVRAGARAESPVVINEFMASNEGTIRDPQGDLEDWIELRNLSESAVDLSGWYLSDDPDKPRKWSFPAGTRIPAAGYLLVWADEDSTESPGLHANFRLSGEGEQILLVDSDEHLNVLRDEVVFGAVGDDVALGRTTALPETFQAVSPTPGSANP
ncbi:MAG: CotH kinase family protein [Verrucomicrobiales bacterium]|nr:CotH kinase family protein [Verrucomicrobiales bacterium]